MRAARMTSPVPSGTVLPSSRDSNSPSSLARAMIVVPTLSSRSERTSGDASDQAGNAARAAFAAASTSAAPPFGYRATTSLVSDGLRLLPGVSAATASPLMKWVSVSVISVSSRPPPVQQSPPGKIAHQSPDPECPGRRQVRCGDSVDQGAELRSRDGDDVADLVREAPARLVAVLDRREQGAEEQGEAVRIMMLAPRLADQLFRVA